MQHAIDLLKLALNLLNATAEEAMAEALATGALLLACGFRLQLDDASTSGEHLKGFGNGISGGLIQQTLHRAFQQPLALVAMLCRQHQQQRGLGPLLAPKR